MRWTVEHGSWADMPWRVVRSHPKTTTGLIRRLQRYPDDVMLLLFDDVRHLSRPELDDAGVGLSYSITDLGWVAWGPKQRVRAENARPRPRKAKP